MLMRWESMSSGRYYLVHVQVDLFGELTLRRVWGGGQHGRRGGERLECLKPEVRIPATRDHQVQFGLISKSGSF